jgi:hypothetical protein
MMRYFLQGKFGPWYEVTPDQWEDLHLHLVDVENEAGHDVFGQMLIPGVMINMYTVPLMKAVYVNTAKVLYEDVKHYYGDLVDLIWFPDMRCGDCGGRLFDANRDDAEQRYPKYMHAGAVMHRHGAYPVERWED